MSSLLAGVLQANIYHQPVIFGLTMVTNLLNIRVLSARSLRSSPCSHYFLAYAIFSIIYIALMCPTQMLRGLGHDWTNDRIGCKVHFYLMFLVPLQANAMLLFASFDRYYTSRKSRQMQTAGSVRTARLVIITGTVLLAAYLSPMPIIYSWNETTKLCSPPSTPFVFGYVASQIIGFYVLSPILLITFGALTIININQQRTRVGPKMSSSTHRRTESQLASMLLLQIGVHLILTIPFGVTYAMNSFDPSTRTANIFAIRYILVAFTEIDYFVSFFLYVFSASIYRRELRRLFHLPPSCLIWNRRY